MEREEEKFYKIGIYWSKKLIYVWEGYAFSIEQAREFAYEDFEMNSYAEEIVDIA